jgi:hypothetical protein
VVLFIKRGESMFRERIPVVVHHLSAYA